MVLKSKRFAFKTRPSYNSGSVQILKIMWGGFHMSDYRINFGNLIGPSDTDKLYDMLDIVGPDDELIIAVDAVHESPQYDTIFRVLEENEFDFSTKGAHVGGKYNIIARRRR
jgi:hypothetical protein